MARNITFVGGELQVNLADPLDSTNGVVGSQAQPAVTALPNGNFVVVYLNDFKNTGDLDIMGIEFTPTGAVVNGPVRVEFDTGDQEDIDVAPRLAGGYAVVFEDNGADGNNNDFISLAIILPGGPPDPTEFTVEDFPANFLEEASIGTFANGSYIVTYTKNNIVEADIRFAIINADGTAYLTPPTDLAIGTEQQEHSRIATTGNLAAVVYGHFPSGVGNGAIILKTVNSAGAVIDTETVTPFGAIDPEVAALTDGRFIVVWGGDNTGVVSGRIYDPAAETFAGPEFTISGTGSTQFSPAVTGLADGGFLVTWQGFSGGSADVRARRYDSGGAPVGDEFNASGPGFQGGASLATNAAGLVFASWTNLDLSNTSDTDGGVQGQILLPVTEVVNGTDGDDIITTYGLGEAINGLNGDDIISGVGGNDVIHGDAGLDRLLGGSGNDMLFGDSGIDVINGEDGNDVLAGGRSKDVMNGGLGADKFDFNKLAESQVGAALRDVVKDFRHSEGDRIDLKDIDADTNASPGNQKFKFIGAGAFTGAERELRFVSGIVQGDTNGDGIANFEIKVLTGGVALVAADFVL